MPNTTDKKLRETVANLTHGIVFDIEFQAGSLKDRLTLPLFA